MSNHSDSNEQNSVNKNIAEENSNLEPNTNDNKESSFLKFLNSTAPNNEIFTQKDDDLSKEVHEINFSITESTNNLNFKSDSEINTSNENIINSDAALVFEEHSLENANNDISTEVSENLENTNDVSKEIFENSENEDELSSEKKENDFNYEEEKVLPTEELTEKSIEESVEEVDDEFDKKQDNELVFNDNIETEDFDKEISFPQRLSSQIDNIPQNNDTVAENQAVAKTKAPKAGKGKANNTSIYKKNNPGIAEKTFQICSYLAIPILLLLTIAICYQHILFPRDLWVNEEVVLADVYLNLLKTGNFFSLTSNGSLFTEAGPLYFMTIWLIDLIPQIDMPRVFMGSLILFNCLYILSIWFFARALGYGKQVALAAGLIGLTTFSFLGLSNYLTVDIFYVTLMNFSFLCFYRGWRKNNGFFWLSFAFIFLAASVLVKGPLSFAVFLLAAILYLLFSSNFRKLNSGDGILGFLIFLIVVFSWIFYLYFNNEDTYIKELIQTQILNPIFEDSGKSYYFYAIVLPIVSLPFIFSILYVNWFRALISLPKVFKNRKNHIGGAWLFCILLVSLAILTLLKEKSAIFILIVMPILAILFARAIFSYGMLANRLYFALMSLVLFVLGIFAIGLEFHVEIMPYLPKMDFISVEVPGFIALAINSSSYALLYFGGVLVLFSLILWRLTRRNFAGGSILVFSLALIIAMQPLNIFMTSSVNAIYSPKNQANILAEYGEKSYTVATYKLYPAIYTYYYNIAKNEKDYPLNSIPNFESQESFLQFLNENKMAIVALPTNELDSLANKEMAKVINSSWLENKSVSLCLFETENTETENTETEIPEADIKTDDMAQEEKLEEQNNFTQNLDQDANYETNSIDLENSQKIMDAKENEVSLESQTNNEENNINTEMQTSYETGIQSLQENSDLESLESEELIPENNLEQNNEVNTEESNQEINNSQDDINSSNLDQNTLGGGEETSSKTEVEAKQ